MLKSGDSAMGSRSTSAKKSFTGDKKDVLRRSRLRSCDDPLRSCDDPLRSCDATPGTGFFCTCVCLLVEGGGPRSNECCLFLLFGAGDLSSLEHGELSEVRWCGLLHSSSLESSKVQQSEMSWSVVSLW